MQYSIIAFQINWLSLNLHILFVVFDEENLGCRFLLQLQAAGDSSVRRAGCWFKHLNDGANRIKSITIIERPNRYQQVPTRLKQG
ncbi:TPA: hypothetical protein ACPSKE_003330 [Legionella feeleii]